MYDSVVSCSATMAVAWNLKSFLKSPAISLTNRWNGSFLMSSSVDFWYRRISRRATVPGRNRLTFLTPPVDGTEFRAALVADCCLSALFPSMTSMSRFWSTVSVHGVIDTLPHSPQKGLCRPSQLRCILQFANERFIVRQRDKSENETA